MSPKGKKKGLERRLYTGMSPVPTGKTVAGQHVQSTCCGLGLNPVWTDAASSFVTYHHCRAGYLKTMKRSSASLPWTNMNQRQKRVYGSKTIKQPMSRPILQSCPWMTLSWVLVIKAHCFFCGLEILWVSSSSRRVGEGGWGPPGWEMFWDHGTHCSRGPLSPGNVDSLMGMLHLSSCKTQRHLLETQKSESTHR